MGGLRNVLAVFQIGESRDDALPRQDELVMKQLIAEQGHKSTLLLVCALRNTGTRLLHKEDFTD